jgi:hypothetical protein
MNGRLRLPAKHRQKSPARALPFSPKYGTLSLQKLLKHEHFVNRRPNRTLKACAAVLNEQARCLLEKV